MKKKIAQGLDRLPEKMYRVKLTKYNKNPKTVFEKMVKK